MNSVRDNFVAIDIEYATRQQDICQFAVVVVRNLEIVEKRSWLIQPKNNYYDEYFSNIHHITAKDTIDSPTFDNVWLNEIREYLVNEQVWAHNAVSAEKPIITKNLLNYGINEESLDICDSRDLYQRTDCMPNCGNSLVLCCMALDIPFDTSLHHDALYDAVKCAEIVMSYAKGKTPKWDNVPNNLEEFRKSLQDKKILRIGNFNEYYNNETHSNEDVFTVLSSTDGLEIEQVIDVFDKGDTIKELNSESIDFSSIDTSENNPLFGKRVVVTGLFKINRGEIQKALEMMGAKCLSSVNGKTDVVIFGTHNVGYKKMISLEQQEMKGHHIFRIVGDDDLKSLLCGDGYKFFQN